MRSCGGCTLCCKVIGVHEIAKPKGVLCTHCKPGSGCMVHASRPKACRAYTCRCTADQVMAVYPNRNVEVNARAP